MGTATASTGRYLLIEDNRSWSRKAVEGAEFPPGVGEHLRALMGAVAGLRIQLIRRPDRDPDQNGHRVYTASAASGQVFVREVQTLGEVLSIGPDVFGATDIPAGMGLSAEPLVLVCTHGRRDRCCARHGTALFSELDRHDGLDLWQTSHLGGHRFAPTLLVLPSTVCYGRVGMTEVPQMIDAIRNDRIWSLDRYRGRTRYPTVAQVAEHWVRAERGLWGLDAVLPGPVGEEPNGVQRVQVSLEDGSEQVVRMEAGVLETLRPKSCGDAPSPVSTYRRL